MVSSREFVMFGADDWGRHPSSSQHVARVLARKNRVLWVDSIGMRRPQPRLRDFTRIWQKLIQASRQSGPSRSPDGITVMVPIAIPFHGLSLAEFINRRLVAWQVKQSVVQAGLSDPILWFTSPMPDYVLDSYPRAPVIYYLADDYAAHYPDYAATIRAKETHLLQHANLVLAASEKLLQAIRERHSRVRLLPHGVDFDHFANPVTELPADLAQVPAPRMGYVGLIRDLIDLELLFMLATAQPQWSLVLIGEMAAEIPTLLALPNVHWLGRKAYGELPRYVAALDVGLLPYRYTDVTHHCNPLKLREYLAAGIPVVSYDYPSVHAYGDVIRIAKTRDEFVTQVASSLADSGQEAVARRRARVVRETWDEMVENVSPLIEALGPSRRPVSSKQKVIG